LIPSDFEKYLDDLEEMKKRCEAANVKSLIITGTSLRESRHAIQLAKEHGRYPCIDIRRVFII
jgi:TatD DNase family protein